MKLDPKETLFEVTEETPTQGLCVVVHELGHDDEFDEDISPENNYPSLNHKGSNFVFEDEGYGSWTVSTRDGTKPTRHAIIEHLQNFGFTYCTADDLSEYKAGTKKVPLESSYIVIRKLSDVLIELVPVIQTREIRKPSLMYVASAEFDHDTTISAWFEDEHYNSHEKVFGSDCHTAYNIFGDTDEVKSVIYSLLQEIQKDSTPVHDLHNDLGDYILISMWDKDGKAFATISMDNEYVSEAYNDVLDSNDKVQVLLGGAGNDDLDLPYAIMQYLKVEGDEEDEEEGIDFFLNNDVEPDSCLDLMKFVVRNVLTIQMYNDLSTGMEVKRKMDALERDNAIEQFNPVRLVFIAGSSNKEFNVEVQGNKLITKYGKIGKPLKEDTKEFESSEKAQKEYTKKIKSKMNSGYVLE